MDTDQLNKLLLDRQMEMLKNASPECWHCVAMNHNWGDELDVLFWIVSQPECDKATALLIFWKGEPTAYDLEDEDREMGEDPYAVAPMLKYIVRRFNTTGYSRSKIAFDIWVAKTRSGRSDPHGILPESYYSAVEAGMRRDFEELVASRDATADPTLKVPDEMLVFGIDGYDIDDFEEVEDFYYSFPVSFDYDTGELFYHDRPSGEQGSGKTDQSAVLASQRAVSDAEEISSAASSRIRSIRQQVQSVSPGSAHEAWPRQAEVEWQVNGNSRFWSLENEKTWFLFHSIGIGYLSIALFVLSSEKFYAFKWLVAFGVLWLWECWSAFKSLQSFRGDIAAKRIFGALALALFSGVLISLPGYASILLLHEFYGVTIGAIIALVPLQWVISAIYDKAYLRG